MKYISTRGQTEALPFSAVLLTGLAPDGGLFMPETYPQIDKTTLEAWRHLSYTDLAFQIMRLYIDDIPEADLKTLINTTYTSLAFGKDAITPIRTWQNGLHILELSNGPTLAFKDIAMQFLGAVFEYTLEKQNKELNILGATSGDTGSAAEYAMLGKDRIQVFMLSPNGKMSAFQRAQMYSLNEPNIHNIALEGLFDDCQDIVKAIQNDAPFKKNHHIGTVNSINWVRILAQTVYYFKAYFEATKNTEEKVSFSVPSGNFGDVCAGHIARMMGLPIDRLIVATNENDVLDQFFQTGSYRPRVSNAVKITSSPSMDIAKASNLERFVFDLVGRDPEKIQTLWADVAKGTGFDLNEYLDDIRLKFGFDSGLATDEERIETIKNSYQTQDDIIDPHTATGVCVAESLRREGEIMICLETALPAKFEETIIQALGKDVNIPCPDEWQNIDEKQQYVHVMPNQTDAVKAFIKNSLNAN